MGSFEFFDHTGDIGVRVRADSLDELFAAAAEALSESIVDRRLIGTSVSVRIDLRAGDLELLLVDWLAELLYRFETETLLVRNAVVRVATTADDAHLQGIVQGEPFDSARHSIKVLVKAVTYHALQVRQEGGEWRATVVFDV